MKSAISFSQVGKVYPNYGFFTQGLKNIVVRALSQKVTLKGHRVFTDLSFEIPEGQCVGILGRNGAGKSTILGLMAQVIEPTEGTVEVNDRVTPLLELGGGFHPELTGRENIILNAVLLGMTRETAIKETPRIIEFAEIGAFIDQPVRTYSTGMTARLAFSIAAHLDPKILLVDEVLSVGDVSFQKKCEAVFANFKKKGITIILVSHSASTIESFCDRCIWIDGGKLMADGKPSEVIPKYLEKMGSL